MRAAEVLVTWDLPTADLAEAAPNLRSGHLSGAVLDVFDPEPLPSRSPLWGVPQPRGHPPRMGHVGLGVADVDLAAGDIVMRARRAQWTW